MKIATFNVNNVNRRLANLLAWLEAARPDIVCLQELKSTGEAFPHEAIEGAGYGAVVRGERSWNGVAILARNAEPVLTRDALPGDDRDRQSRYIEAAVNGVLVASLYAPNGNPQPGPKFTYKLAWMKRFAAHAETLRQAGVPAVLAGDYNVVPEPRDIYPTTSYAKNALVQPAPRKAFADLLARGWIDAIRTIHPDETIYTFWDYMRNRWPRDAGLRLDHFLLSEAAAARLADAGVDRDVRGAANASDHAPAWIELAEKPVRRKARPSEHAARRGASSPAKPVAGKAPQSPHATPAEAGVHGADAADAATASWTPASAGVARRRGLKNAASSQTGSVAPAPLLVVDGDNFAHRSYHALPKTIRTKQGRPAGALVGFANWLLRVWEAEKPRAVLVGWDTLEAPNPRQQAFPAYQSGRVFDRAIIEQLEVLPDLVAAFGFANARGAGFEADDFLASAAAREEKRGGRVVIASGDRDTFQLATAMTTILYPVKGGVLQRIGPQEVVARYGVLPEQVPDFIALRGDPSDRLPGAPGVGAVRAAAIIREHGTLEAALRAGLFSRIAGDLRLYHGIATMSRKAPLPRIGGQRPSFGRAAAFARERGLHALADRLDRLAG